MPLNKETKPNRKENKSLFNWNLQNIRILIMEDTFSISILEMELYYQEIFQKLSLQTK